MLLRASSFTIRLVEADVFYGIDARTGERGCLGRGGKETVWGRGFRFFG
jgi:hypothetical protein